MKKILHIQCLAKLSGVQKISLEIMRGLDNSEFDKTILFSSSDCTGDKSALEKAFTEAGCKIIYSDNMVRELNPVKDFKAIREIRKLCKQNGYDVVHTHSSMLGVVGRIGATLAGVPLVIHTVHGLSFTKYTPPLLYAAYFIFETIASFFCTKITSVNKYYLRFFKLFRRKTETVYNGMDFNELEKKRVNKLEDSQHIRLLFVGRLAPPKNILTILKAFKLAHDKKENLTLTVVGDGEFYADCQKYISDNNFSSCVYLEGWKSNPVPYYCNSDIFISSSLYEAFGLMFLEASYFNLPILASNVEGIPKVVLDGKTGLLNAPNDIEKLSEHILLLANDFQKRSELGENGHRYVTEQFSNSVMVEKYKENYSIVEGEVLKYSVTHSDLEVAA